MAETSEKINKVLTNVTQSLTKDEQTRARSNIDASSADDSNLVHKSDTETITGQKTFTDLLIATSISSNSIGVTGNISASQSIWAENSTSPMLMVKKLSSDSKTAIAIATMTIDSNSHLLLSMGTPTGSNSTSIISYDTGSSTYVFNGLIDSAKTASDYSSSGTIASQFGNMVTITGDQTITGSKTFSSGLTVSNAKQDATLAANIIAGNSIGASGNITASGNMSCNGNMSAMGTFAAYGGSVISGIFDDTPFLYADRYHTGTGGTAYIQARTALGLDSNMQTILYRKVSDADAENIIAYEYNTVEKYVFYGLAQYAINDALGHGIHETYLTYNNQPTILPTVSTEATSSTAITISSSTTPALTGLWTLSNPSQCIYDFNVLVNYVSNADNTTFKVFVYKKSSGYSDSDIIYTYAFAGSGDGCTTVPVKLSFAKGTTGINLMIIVTRSYDTGKFSAALSGMYMPYTPGSAT